MKRKATQTGMKNTKRGLMEPRLEGRWDRMEKGGWRKKKDVFSGID